MGAVKIGSHVVPSEQLAYTHCMYTKAAALIKKGDEYLLVKENHSYQNRSWNWPQGKVEEGESPDSAAIREAKEETGLDIKIEKQLGMLEDTFPDTEKLHVFLASPVSGFLKIAESELEDAGWFSRGQIHQMHDELVGKWILETLDSI